MRTQISLNSIEFSVFEDNKSAAKIHNLPPLVDCAWRPKDCSSTWNKSHCQADLDYAQPIKDGDKIIIQTQFLDYVNKSPIFSCHSPLQYNKAVAQVSFGNKPGVIYGDSGNCIYYNLSLTNIGCLEGGDQIALRTCSYNNFDEWVTGVIDHYVDHGVIGNGIVTRIDNTTMEIVWDIDEFETLWDRSPCTEEIMHCFYRRTPYLSPVSPSADYVPVTITQLAVSCCEQDTECLTIAQGEDGGCNVPVGKMSFKFQIVNHPHYVFGAAAGVSDAGISFVKESTLFCTIHDLLNNLLKFSYATDFSNYCDNVYTYLTTVYCLPTDVVTYDNVTGEFEILFNQLAHIDDSGWDPCSDKPVICKPNFPVPNESGACTFDGEYLEIEFKFQGNLSGGYPSEFTLFDDAGNLFWNKTGLANANGLAYIFDVINKFNADFPNSYAEASGLIDSVLIPNIRFYLSETDVANMCEAIKWNALASGAWSVEFVNRNLCCDKLCVQNATGEITLINSMANKIGFFQSTPVTYEVRMYYSCNKNILPNVPLGAYFNVTASSYSEFLLNCVCAINTEGVLSMAGVPSPASWRAKLNSTEIQINTLASNFPCGCENINFWIEVRRSVAFGLYTYNAKTLSRNVCCQPDCTIPPDSVRLSWEMLESDYAFGNPAFSSFLNIVPEDADCADYNYEPLEYTVQSAEVSTFGEFVSLFQKRLIEKFNNTFTTHTSHGTSVVVSKLAGGVFKFVMTTNRFHPTYGDLCNGLKVCQGYTNGNSGICYETFEIRFLTITSYILDGGEYKFSYDLAFTCNKSSSYTYSETISFSFVTMPTIDDVISQFLIEVTMKGWQAELLPSPPAAPRTIKLKIPESKFSCMCEEGVPAYVTTTIANTPDSTVIHYSKSSQIIYYRGTERSTGSGGDGHMIKANNVVFESDCCEECWNPYGYTGLVFEVDHPAIADFQVEWLGTGECSGGVMVDWSGYLSGGRDLIGKINTIGFPYVYAENSGNLITLFVKNPQHCPCKNEEDEWNLSVKINGGEVLYHKYPDCCDGEGEIGTEQIPEVLVTERKCCPDFVSSVELVDCCCNPIPDYDVRTALVGHLFGQNSSPLQFFQNYSFDSSLIPFECFAFKFTDARGIVHYSECYKKETCLSTVELCSDYTEGRRDCEGMVYGIPEFGCPMVLEPLYSNCMKIPGEIKTVSFDYTNPSSNKRVSKEHIQLRTGLIPPFVVERLNAILAGGNLTVNGKSVTYEGTIDKSRDQGDMWIVTIELIGKECEIDKACD